MDHTDKSRRAFLRNLALITVAAAAAPVVMLGHDSRATAAGAPVGDGLERTRFATLVGERFEIRGDAIEPCAVTLTEVARHDRGPAVDNFTVHFSPTAVSLKQGTYRFAHPHMGEFDLFVVPERIASGEGYVAVFNRLT